jgi:hypothetical protein
VPTYLEVPPGRYCPADVATCAVPVALAEAAGPLEIGVTAGVVGGIEVPVVATCGCVVAVLIGTSATLLGVPKP